MLPDCLSSPHTLISNNRNLAATGVATRHAVSVSHPISPLIGLTYGDHERFALV